MKFLSKLACQRYSKIPVNRILGGETVESGEFPWMVNFSPKFFNSNEISLFQFQLHSKAALGYLNEDYEVTFDCGGTVISEFFVMTAAHCVKLSREPVVVRLGKVSSNQFLLKRKNRKTLNP